MIEMENATSTVDYEIVHQRKTLKLQLGNTHKTTARDQTKQLNI